MILAACVSACSCGGGNGNVRLPPPQDAVHNAADRIDPRALDAYARDLGNGLAYRVQLRVAVVDAETRASRTVADVACMVTFDLWDQIYVVRADELAEPVKVRGLRRVPSACVGVAPVDLRAKVVPIGELVTRASVSRVLPEPTGRRDIW